MRKITIYIYAGKNGTIQTPIELPLEHTTETRLYSDSGMILKKGNEYAEVIDVPADDVKNWTEVEFTEDIVKILEAE